MNRRPSGIAGSTGPQRQAVGRFLSGVTALDPGDYVLGAEDSEELLKDELRRWSAVIPSRSVTPGLLVWPAGSLASALSSADAVTVTLSSGAGTRPLVFARQTLPEARPIAVPSIRAGAETVVAAIMGRLPDAQPWLLHVAPHYGFGEAGQNRCRLIREAVIEQLQRRRRVLRRALSPDAAPLAPTHSIVQLLLASPEVGLLSVAVAPMPFQLRRVMSPFPKGIVPVASDRAAPCRAFAKLVEAEQRLGRTIHAGETCVDLGACPGSWSYVALGRGANVIAVDRSPLRPDLMTNPRLRFVRGDAFAFEPKAPVDWLLCDVIAAPERSIDLLCNWVHRRWARHFVVTIKFKGVGDYRLLDELTRTLLPMTNEFLLLRLCANKNEACAFGTVQFPI